MEKSNLKNEVLDVIMTYEKEVKNRFGEKDLPPNISALLLDKSMIEIGKISIVVTYIYRILGLSDNYSESDKILRILDWVMTKTNAIEVLERKLNETDLALH